MVLNDYVVIDDGHPVGRIRSESCIQGIVAQIQIFGPERLASALELAEAARERLKAKGK